MLNNKKKCWVNNKKGDIKKEWQKDRVIEMKWETKIWIVMKKDTKDMERVLIEA